MEALGPLLDTPTGIVSAAVMAFLAVETIGLTLWAERHRRAAQTLADHLDGEAALRGQATTLARDAERYLRRDLARTIAALEFTEDTTPKVGLLGTFLGIYTMLPQLVDAMVADPASALGLLAPPILTSLAGMAFSLLAGVQRHRLEAAEEALRFALETLTRRAAA
jgi:MotA/TolQ/ExbB proton channel family.